MIWFLLVIVVLAITVMIFLPNIKHAIQKMYNSIKEKREQIKAERQAQKDAEELKKNDLTENLGYDPGKMSFDFHPIIENYIDAEPTTVIEDVPEEEIPDELDTPFEVFDGYVDDLDNFEDMDDDEFDERLLDEKSALVEEITNLSPKIKAMLLTNAMEKKYDPAKIKIIQRINKAKKESDSVE